MRIGKSVVNSGNTNIPKSVRMALNKEKSDKWELEWYSTGTDIVVRARNCAGEVTYKKESGEGEQAKSHNNG